LIEPQREDAGPLSAEFVRDLHAVKGDVA